MKPSILLIKKYATDLLELLNREIAGNAQIYTTDNGIDGLRQYQALRPSIVIVDDALDDIRGQSVAAIIKDADSDAFVYVIGIKNMLDNSKADVFLGITFDTAIFCYQVHADLMKRANNTPLDDGVLKAIQIQNDMLPKPIQTTRFHIHGMFSAYSRLSGDGINYWYSDPNENKDMLYGYLFDCVGHDLSSYGQVGSLWLSLKKEMKFYQMGVHKTLGEVMNAINVDLVTLYDYVNIASALAFCFDFEEQVLCYCPAAIPCILTRRKGSKRRERIMCRSSRLGYEQDTIFREEKLSLKDLAEVIFLSDGLSDLLLDQDEEALDIAKHDDVSAIFVTLK